MNYLTENSFNRLVEYGFLRNTYLFHRCGLGIGLIKTPIPFPYHSFAWESSHTIPIYGKGMDFYEIRIFPMGKTIERQNMASYGFDMVGYVPYQNHVKSIYGPYHTHIWPIPHSLVRAPHRFLRIGTFSANSN